MGEGDGSENGNGASQECWDVLSDVALVVKLVVVGMAIYGGRGGGRGSWPVSFVLMLLCMRVLYCRGI